MTARYFLRYVAFALIAGISISRANEFPDRLPMGDGGFKISTPDGIRYIPDLVIAESNLLLDYEEAESPVVGTLELVVSLGDATFHRNFARLNANREANGLPLLELQPLVNLRMTIDVPGSVNPSVSGLIASVPDRQSVEVALNQEQVRMLHALDQQAGWLPQVTVSALIAGEYRPIQQLEPLRHQTLRKARSRTLRLLPSTGFSDHTVKLTVTQPAHDIRQVQLLSATGSDFPNLHLAPTYIECEYAEVPGFPHRLRFLFNRWTDNRASTFSLPLQVRSAVVRPSLFTDVPERSVQFMVLIFDASGTAMLSFLEKPLDTDEIVTILTRSGVGMTSGYLLGFEDNGQLNHVLRLKIPADLGTPTFNLVADGEVAKLVDVLREKFTERILRETIPVANDEARQCLLEIAAPLKLLQREFDVQQFNLLGKGDRSALLQYCSMLEALQLNATRETHADFLACCIVSTIAFDFGDVAPEEQNQAFHVVASQLSGKLSPSEDQVRQLIRTAFSRLMTSVLDRFEIQPNPTTNTDLIHDCQLLRTCYLLFPFLADQIEMEDERYAVAIALTHSELLDEASRGVELLEENVAAKHVPSMELLATLLANGSVVLSPDVNQAVLVCESGVELQSRYCIRLLGVLHKEQRIENWDVQTAISLLQRAANLGDKQAMVHLGDIFCVKESPEDVDQALQWYQQAADTLPAAMVGAGKILQSRGQDDFLELFEHAADLQYPEGQYLLAMAISSEAPADEIKDLLKQAALGGHDPAVTEYMRRSSAELVGLNRSLFAEVNDLDDVQQSILASEIARDVYSAVGAKATINFIRGQPTASLRDWTVRNLVSFTGPVTLADLPKFEEVVSPETRTTFEIGHFGRLLDNSRFEEAFALEQEKNLSEQSAWDDFELFFEAKVHFLVRAGEFDVAIRLNRLFQEERRRESGWLGIATALMKEGQADRANDLLKQNASAQTIAHFEARAIHDRYLAGELSVDEVIVKINSLTDLEEGGTHASLTGLAFLGFEQGKPLAEVRRLLREGNAQHVAYMVVEALAKAQRFGDALLVAREIPDARPQLANRDNARREAITVIAYHQALCGHFEEAKSTAAELPAIVMQPTGFSLPADRAQLLSSIARVELDAGLRQQSLETLRTMNALLADNPPRAKWLSSDYCFAIPETGDVAFLNSVWNEFADGEDSSLKFLTMRTHAYARRYSEAEAILDDFSGDSAWDARSMLCSLQFENGDLDALRASLEKLPPREGMEFPGPFDRRTRLIKDFIVELVIKKDYQTALSFTELIPTESERLRSLETIYDGLKQAEQVPANFTLMKKIEAQVAGSAEGLSLATKPAQMSILFEQARVFWGRGDYRSLLDVVDTITGVGTAVVANNDIAVRDRIRINSNASYYLETLRKQRRTYKDYIQSLTAGPE